MDSTFTLEIVTPYRLFLNGSADMIVVKTVDGELGIMANHEPIVTPLAIGIAKVKVDGIWKYAALSDGFLEMDGNKATLVVGSAEWPEEIDLERARRSLKRATERLNDGNMPWESERVLRAVQRARTRIEIATRESNNA
jgi:F-type H+-transporting ATPase subunit epsilon